jgi:hypothetical protein
VRAIDRALATRRICVLGQPHGAWIQQVARNLVDHVDGNNLESTTAYDQTIHGLPSRATGVARQPTQSPHVHDSVVVSPYVIRVANTSSVRGKRRQTEVQSNDYRMDPDRDPTVRSSPSSSSGKTFAIANVIAEVDRPTLIIA